MLLCSLIFDAALGKVEVVPQGLGRVLNLCNNALCYRAKKQRISQMVISKVS